MYLVRCEICCTRLPTPKRLMSHYLSGHSKLKLAREIFKLSIRSTLPKMIAKKRKNKTESRSETIPRTTEEPDMVFANDSVQILYRNNEIIIRDDKSSVDMEFSFDENSNEVGKNCFAFASAKVGNGKEDLKASVGEVNNNAPKKNEQRNLLQFKNETVGDPLALGTSSSSASSEDSSKKFSFKKKIRKRRDTRDKTRHYKINITRTNNVQSLNENTGLFYQCNCREDNRKKASVDSTGLKLTSDTESASDTGRASSSNEPNVFCSKCGNGYRDERLLLEHMKIHETHCRVCNEIFPTEQEFKQHVESHIFKVFVCPLCHYEFPAKPILQLHFEDHKEDSILESVIDIEEDYNLTPYSPSNMTYQSTIEGIMSYLMETDCSGSHCAICHSEIYF